MIENNIYFYLTVHLEVLLTKLTDRFEKEIEDSSDLRGVVLIIVTGVGLIAMITLLAMLSVNSFKYIVSLLFSP